jgi:hypothetical protein
VQRNTHKVFSTAFKTLNTKEGKSTKEEDHKDWKQKQKKSVTIIKQSIPSPWQAPAVLAAHS